VPTRAVRIHSGAWREGSRYVPGGVYLDGEWGVASHQGWIAQSGETGPSDTTNAEWALIEPLLPPPPAPHPGAATQRSNDMAVSGAVPMFLPPGFILEQGFPVGDLRRIFDHGRWIR
jgi:hypothetical protein